MTAYVQSALFSIFHNKIRSLLTVLGVVIGVASVTTLVALGQGLKNDTSNLIRGLGTNIIAVTPGKIDLSGGFGSQANTNVADFVSTDILTTKDIATIQSNPNVSMVTPLSLISQAVVYQHNYTTPMVAGAYGNFLQIINSLTLSQGKMFSNSDQGNDIVLNYASAQSLFGNQSAIGKTVILGKTSFIVIGVLSQSSQTTALGSEFNNIALIPYQAAFRLNNSQNKIYRIIVKIKDSADVKQAKSQIQQALLANHNQQDNFSVLTQDDLLSLFNQFLSLATTLVSAIAAISLIVGGIGIMNIMLVVVTERTKEIGLRKAVGATKKAILAQFLIEAIFITLLGGLLGLLVTVISTSLIKHYTSLSPDITAGVVAMAIGVSMVVGIVFGLWPAMRAANKDPIEALRYE